MSAFVVEADLDRAEHARDIVALTAAYATDPMGNGAPLPAPVLEQLIPGLRAHPTTKVFLLYDGNRAVGIATCFVGFSTFRARPLINLHDFAVLPTERGRGLGLLLLQSVLAKAVEAGCCKVTLEVQEGNKIARRVYERVGFRHAVYGEQNGGTLFYSCELSPGHALQWMRDDARC
jgi:GNAT superfamily N-acetyltransferase